MRNHSSQSEIVNFIENCKFTLDNNNMYCAVLENCKFILDNNNMY